MAKVSKENVVRARAGLDQLNGRTWVETLRSIATYLDQTDPLIEEATGQDWQFDPAEDFVQDDLRKIADWLEKIGV